MNSRIAIIRLVSGEEILTEVVGVFSDHLKVKNPVQIVLMPSKEDPSVPRVALAPWAQFAAKKEFNIPNTAVILDYEPVAEFVNQYKQMHGGIITPPQKLILP